MKNKQTPKIEKSKILPPLLKSCGIYTLVVAVVFFILFIIDYTTDFVVYEDKMQTSSYIMLVPLWVLVTASIFVWLAGLAVIIWKKWNIIKNSYEGKQAMDMAIDKEKLQKRISRRYITRFLTMFIVYVIILLFLLLVGMFIKNSNIWYARDPWFPFLWFLKENIFFIFGFLLIAGGIVLMFLQWRQSSKDIVGLVGSITELYQKPGSTEISVPENLSELQPILQKMQYESLLSESKAREAEQRKNELIMYLAHDIRTPLTSIIGYLSLLEEAPDMPLEQRAKYTHITLDKAYRLEGLINQFFEISRYNLHEMVLEPERFDLCYLMLQLTDEFFPVVSERDKQIEINAGKEEIWMTGDPDKLARVFNNILRNAIAYSRANSRIVIDLQQDTESITIQFTNMGKTIPPHKLNTIFDKFYRLDDARGTDIGGAGLGLAIAKEIIELHKGGISAESQDGTTVFTVILPSEV